MNKEEELLVNICKCYFSGGRLEAIDGADYNKLYPLARAHNLVGICHCVFNENEGIVPDDIRGLFFNKFIDLVYIANNQFGAYEEISALLCDEKIPFIPVKGIALKALYPVPESRTMGDIDILIKEADCKSIRAALKTIGFEYEQSDGFVDAYGRNGVKLEVHTKLTEDFEAAFDNAFDNAVFDGCIGKIDDSFHLAYLVAHTAKHLKYHGAGIRLVMDIAYMLKYASISYDTVFAVLDKINLSTFGRVLFSVCYEWFGCGEHFTEATQRIQDYLLKFGAFGAEKDYSRQSMSRLIQFGTIDDKGKKSRLRLMLGLAFPPYHILKDMPQLHFLAGRRWLTPFAWIYRILYALRHNLKHTKNMIKGINGSTGELAENELDFFEEIGLI